MNTNSPKIEKNSGGDKAVYKKYCQFFKSFKGDWR